MAEPVLKNKSFAFAVRIVRLAQYLQGDKKEYVMSRQVLRSGTAVGALVREAEYGESKLDFIHKLTIALKEANEASYWLELLNETDYLEEGLFLSLHSNLKELIALLISSIKTTKSNMDKESSKLNKGKNKQQQQKDI